MKIPRSFQLAGITWTVEEVDGMTEQGLCDSERANIKLRKGLPAQVKEATFCHELEHAILFSMGRTDHDEREVDAHGNLLHQFLNSQK